MQRVETRGKTKTDVLFEQIFFVSRSTQRSLLLLFFHILNIRAKKEVTTSEMKRERVRGGGAREFVVLHLLHSASMYRISTIPISGIHKPRNCLLKSRSLRGTKELNDVEPCHSLVYPPSSLSTSG